MPAFLLFIWKGLKGLVGLLVPFVGGVRQFSGWSAVTRWTVRLILLVLILAALFFLNHYFEMEKGIKGPRVLGQSYLPILFLLLLGWMWLGWYLWQLLMEEDVSEFPDIDAAWQEATAALAAAGIDLKRVSVYLVLGQNLGGEGPLFEAGFPSSQRPLRVRGEPRRLAPLHVYATEDAVYVTCARASVLGRHAALLARHAGGAAAPGPSAAAGPGPGMEVSMLGRSMRQTIFQTMQPGGRPGDVQKILNKAAQEKRPLTDDEQKEMRRLLGGENGDSFAPQGRPNRPTLIKDEAELELHAARLRHLCRLVARSRRPELPAKGLMVLLPWAGTETDEAANATTEACRRDLAAAREGLQVVCPHFTLVTDLETAPGFGEFLGHFDERLRRNGRVGKSFPLAPDPRALPKLFDAGMEWFCAGEFPTWVYEFFRLELSQPDERPAATEANVNLYQLLVQLLDRRQRLSRILARGLAAEGSAPTMLGGCYLAGTGSAAAEQGFVAAVFDRLRKERESAGWAEDACAADAANRAWGTYGLVGLGVAVAVLAAVGAVMWMKVKK